MTDIEKLRALLPHWMEHNEEHAVEFAGWAEKASSAGQAEVAQMIRRAAEEMRQANDTLRTALKELGGPTPVEAHSHSH
jgi:acyl-CoA reductase-like NAD-dependent aldehyde dehydrogenase